MFMSLRVSETILYKQTFFEHLSITFECKKMLHILTIPIKLQRVTVYIMMNLELNKKAPSSTKDKYYIHWHPQTPKLFNQHIII